jgi:hypothetical protein
MSEYLYDKRTTTQAVHSLTYYKTPFLVSFSLPWDKTKRRDRIDGKYLIWAIYLHIRGVGVKYLDSLKLESNSYYIIRRIVLSNTLGM